MFLGNNCCNIRLIYLDFKDNGCVLFGYIYYLDKKVIHFIRFKLAKGHDTHNSVKFSNYSEIVNPLEYNSLVLYLFPTFATLKSKI